MSVLGWLTAGDTHYVVLSHFWKTSYEYSIGQRPRSDWGQFTRLRRLSFIVSSLYAECCIGITSLFQRRLSANGGGQAPKNAEFILDKVAQNKVGYWSSCWP